MALHFKQLLEEAVGFQSNCGISPWGAKWHLLLSGNSWFCNYKLIKNRIITKILIINYKKYHTFKVLKLTLSDCSCGSSVSMCPSISAFEIPHFLAKSSKIEYLIWLLSTTRWRSLDGELTTAEIASWSQLLLSLTASGNRVNYWEIFGNIWLSLWCLAHLNLSTWLSTKGNRPRRNFWAKGRVLASRVDPARNSGLGLG